MNKAQLVDAVASSTGMTKKAVADVLDSVLKEIMGAVKGGQTVTITGFGTFLARHKAASVKRNPRTGTPVNVPAKNVPKFRAGKAFKELVK